MLVGVVSATTVLALFVHAHPDDHESDHHAPHAIHAHLGGHAHPGRPVPAHGAIVDDDDGRDRAVFLNTFVAEGTAALHITAAVPEAIRLPRPIERPAQPSLLVVHGHDPPAVSLVPARAPPRLPVLI
jgi:hypothetical protein